MQAQGFDVQEVEVLSPHSSEDTESEDMIEDAPVLSQVRS